VFEFKDNFLMGPDSALENEKRVSRDCFASNAAKDELEQLALLVGEHSTLQSASGPENIALVDKAPTLEFDLEDELARAFQTNEPQTDATVVTDLPTAPEPIVELAEPDVQSPAFFKVDSVADNLETALGLQIDATGSPPATPISDDPMMDFSDMIANELDKALAEEVATDPALGKNADELDRPAGDIEAELSKLMSFAEPREPAVTVAKPVAPPIPESIMDPWQEAEFVPAGNMSVEESLGNAELPDLSSALQQPEQFITSPDGTTNSAETEKTTNDDSNDEYIDLVLGGAAALASAAATGQVASVSAAPVAETSEPLPTAQSDFDPASALAMTEHDADLRVRLEELDHQHDHEKSKGGRRAAFAIVAVALLGGVAALGWNYSDGGGGETPTLLASTEPVKIKPKDAGGKVVPNQDQAVYQTADETPAQQDRLTDKKEKPITVAVAPSEKAIARVSANPEQENRRMILKPRSVRTVVVKPDGTIVSSTGSTTTAGPASFASGSVIESPTLSLQSSVNEQVSAVESATVAAALRTTTVAAETIPKAAAETASNIPSSGSSTSSPSVTAKPAAVKPVAAKPVAAKPIAAKPVAAKPVIVKPVKVETAAAKPVAAKPVKVAAVEPKPVTKTSAKPVARPAATPQPKAASGTEDLPSVTSAYAVQVSSQRSSAAAKKSYATLTRRFPGILDGKGVDIRKADIKGKGTYYRVRIPADNRSAANQICSQLKAKGGDCFVTR
jgi:hypothetical protein